MYGISHTIKASFIDKRSECLPPSGGQKDLSLFHIAPIKLDHLFDESLLDRRSQNFQVLKNYAESRITSDGDLGKVFFLISRIFFLRIHF